MSGPVVDQVVDFYGCLFTRMFSDSFRPRVTDRLKRNAVVRQVEECADAACQSLTRFLVNERVPDEQASEILQSLGGIGDVLTTERISNPNVTPESLAEEVLDRLPPPEALERAGRAAVYRVALHAVVQVLTLVGPVCSEWQKLGFSSSYEPVKKIVSRLNQISQQLEELARSGQDAADELYELNYRDYLLQRFYRIEAGTVRMTTSLDVDLRELFVMPQVRPRPEGLGDSPGAAETAKAFLDLKAARDSLREVADDNKQKSGLPALDQVRSSARCVIVGTPGSGKSTFLEWLQLKLASVEEELVMGGQQAIPLLLRVRQLDPRRLPRGRALLEAAMASTDRAALMPVGWIARQMAQGRVIVMLDGLDETDPEQRDRYLLPWLAGLCREFPDCRYLVSSRPVGYVAGALRSLGFVECDLLDFSEPQILQFTQHWCTAVRLARNEPPAEARREGEIDGKTIVNTFREHPYIPNLARNPLMLSAICLVNYFEGGQLPKDRSVLYRMCVEGLLHHWDQRRGIRSEFALAEKLAVCREVALAMQSEDRAEYEAEKVHTVFAEVLKDAARASQLLEHIRYRTGLLLERRPGVFAFAHLTFQEYLAAHAVNEGNRLGIDSGRLVREHDDGRWHEVVALYCGLAPAPAVRQLIDDLIASPDTRSLSAVLGEAYLSAPKQVTDDRILRDRVLRRMAAAPNGGMLLRFPVDAVATIANERVGTSQSSYTTSEAFWWLRNRGAWLDSEHLKGKLCGWRSLGAMALAELVFLLHLHGNLGSLGEIGIEEDLYASGGPVFGYGAGYGSQAEIALTALAERGPTEWSDARFHLHLVRLLRTAARAGDYNEFFPAHVQRLVECSGHSTGTLSPHRLSTDVRVRQSEIQARLLAVADALESAWRDPPGAEHGG